jgi:hypothetical protein
MNIGMDLELVSRSDADQRHRAVRAAKERAHWYAMTGKRAILGHFARSRR